MDNGMLQPFLDAPERAGIFSDFDGTLSEIVPLPWDARPVPGAREALAALATRFGTVAVISGRSASQLLEWLGPSVEIWGVHGAERTRNGVVELSEQARPFAELMGRVRNQAQGLIDDAGIEGAIVEDKGVIVALHYRAAADTESAGRALDVIAEGLSREHDLVRGEGRLVFELRPPVTFSKADVLRERVSAGGLNAAMFIGDDTVDLPAFDALDRLSAAGIHAARIAVRSIEAPAELLERADRVVDGPEGVLDLLRSLL